MKRHLVLVLLAALLLCACTITVQMPATAAISPLATPTEKALPSVFLPAPAVSPDVEATAKSIWQGIPATATAKAKLRAQQMPTATPSPTATPTPILAPGIVPVFLAEGYPDIDRWFFIPSQQIRIHFTLKPNGDYDVKGSSATKPEQGDVIWSLCQYQHFKWELGYERPTPKKRAEVLLGCEIERDNPPGLTLLNRFLQHSIDETGNLYDYFEAPPTMTPTP